MAFEDLKARVALLFEQMVDEPEDSHEALIKLRETIAELRATGMPVPSDVLEIEQKLEALEQKQR
ncbi:MAG: hypothetical protein KDJ19_08605 [Hyphomicrobiaceae bacterium]|nr:hypothetical protein [Hyphomicrobiaceae bacterium]MCC0024299.1 hypothetical protein [Hyphomicrobiaceae bacterium]